MTAGGRKERAGAVDMHAPIYSTLRLVFSIRRKCTCDRDDQGGDRRDRTPRVCSPPAAMSNLDNLTRAHQAVAAKRRAKKNQVKEIVFDDTARRYVPRAPRRRYC